jgi:hypothetical protein
MKSTSYAGFGLPRSLSGQTSVPQQHGNDMTAKTGKQVQPPTSSAGNLRLYLEQLRKNSKSGAYTRHTSQTDRLRDRIIHWTESMTPELRSRRFTTEEIESLAGLIGKNGGRAAHHQIALALRSVGFKPCRDWTLAGRNRRYWKFVGDQK